MTLAAVIFDFDGVILDSETAAYESHRRIYERCGVPLTVDEWCEQIGLYAEDEELRWFQQLCARSSSPVTQEEFEAEERRLFHELAPSEPMRGIRALLEALGEAGVPAAIASTSPRGWVVQATERIGLTAMFGAIVSGDEVVRRKPAPDVYLEAARRLGVDPSGAVAIEDSSPGIASARAAGMKTVAIPHWLTDRHDLSAADLRVAHAGELTVSRLATLLGRAGPHPRA